MSGRGKKKGKAKKKAPSWQCSWCQTSKTTRQKYRGPDGPKTLCGKCNKRCRSAGAGPFSNSAPSRRARRTGAASGRGERDPLYQRHSTPARRDQHSPQPPPIHKWAIQRAVNLISTQLAQAGVRTERQRLEVLHVPTVVLLDLREHRALREVLRPARGRAQFFGRDEGRRRCCGDGGEGGDSERRRRSHRRRRRGEGGYP